MPKNAQKTNLWAKSASLKIFDIDDMPGINVYEKIMLNTNPGKKFLIKDAAPKFAGESEIDIN
jgi:hypothetical protein